MGTMLLFSLDTYGVPPHSCELIAHSEIVKMPQELLIQCLLGSRL